MMINGLRVSLIMSGIIIITLIFLLLELKKKIGFRNKLIKDLRKKFILSVLLNILLGICLEILIVIVNSGIVLSNSVADELILQLNSLNQTFASQILKLIFIQGLGFFIFLTIDDIVTYLELFRRR